MTPSRPSPALRMWNILRGPGIQNMNIRRAGELIMSTGPRRRSRESTEGLSVRARGPGVHRAGLYCRTYCRTIHVEQPSKWNIV